jgi:hypothetical protein
MSKDNVKHAHWVTRYNLTIAFEELYTENDAELHASANAIGGVARAIEQLIITDPALQALLQMQNLQLNIISPDRAAKRQVRDGSGDRKRPLSHI